MLKNGLSFLFWVRNKKTAFLAKKRPKKAKMTNCSHNYNCCYQLKIWKKNICGGRPHPKKCHFWPKSAKKGQIRPRSGNKCQLWQQILHALIFLCWKMTLVFDFGSKIKKRHFLPKKWLFSLLAGICHLAWFFYHLKLRYLPQTFRIRCENQISGGYSQLDWTSSKKLGKIRKQCYQTFFLGLTGFNTQNKCKLHSDQVSRHFINKKYGFRLFFDFSWSHPKMGIFF